MPDGVEFVRRDPRSHVLADERDGIRGDATRTADALNSLGRVQVGTRERARCGLADVLRARDAWGHVSQGSLSAGNQMSVAVLRHRIKLSHPAKGQLMSEDPSKQYWYNLKTGVVERGYESPSADRAGPFATAEEAAHAPERFRERSAAWAAEDAAEDR
jgi:hypothetical protein